MVRPLKTTGLIGCMCKVVTFFANTNGRGFDPLKINFRLFAYTSCAEQRQLVGLITQRSTVDPSPATRKYIILSVVQALWNNRYHSNTEVKHFSADDTAFMWENKSPPRDKFEMNNEEITEKLNPDNNILDTMSLSLKNFL